MKRGVTFNVQRAKTYIYILYNGFFSAADDGVCSRLVAPRRTLRLLTPRMQSLLFVALVVLVCALEGVQSFVVRGFLPAKRQTMARPMFGGGSKSKAAASIKVDGKTIVASATPCNLRKELMANGVGASLPRLLPLLLWQRGCC